MSAPTRASVTALGAALVAVAGYVSPTALTVVVLVLSLTFAAGWPRLVELPTNRGGSVVIALTALAALATARFGSVTMLATVMGLAVVGAFAHQMLRRDGRPRLVESIAGIVTGGVVVVSAAGWVTGAGGPVHQALVVTAAATIAAAAAGTAIPAPLRLGGTLATVVAGAVGLLTGYLLASVGMLPGGLVGLATGVLTAALHVLFGQFPASGRLRPALAAALLVVLVVGVPVYMVGGLLDR
ncbi:MAG: hypothetical protein ACYC1Z_10810 [Georgenia sp.]